VFLSGSGVGMPKPITPASIQNPAGHLVCYTATLASRYIPQTGCGATDPTDTGTPIHQYPLAAQRGVYVADQFGPARLNPAKSAIEVCIPSTKGICGNGLTETPEECDGSDDAACSGQPCRADCTCKPLTCGNNVQEGAAEACDGTDDSACGG